MLIVGVKVISLGSLRALGGLTFTSPLEPHLTCTKSSLLPLSSLFPLSSLLPLPSSTATPVSLEFEVTGFVSLSTWSLVGGELEDREVREGGEGGGRGPIISLWLNSSLIKLVLLTDRIKSPTLTLADAGVESDTAITIQNVGIKRYISSFDDICGIDLRVKPNLPA